MDDIYFLCPHCKQRLEAPPEMVGETIDCPACDRRIKIPLAQTRESLAASLGTAKTMAGVFSTGQDDLVGKVFGKDLVRAKIAEGGMGSVWLTEHTELNVARALKTMPEGFSSQQDLVQRFHQEAKVLAQLHHPCIAQIHDFGCQDGVYYFIMEYLPGGSLRARLYPKGTRLPWRTALRIADQVCAGLEYAHGKGIVHRDIKPENILFDEHGNPRIADFGLGKILGDVVRTQSGSLILGQQGMAMEVGQRGGPPASMGERPTTQKSPANMTMLGQIVGTVDYMSPEQRRGGEVSSQSDIYSLGVTLFEMLTGELPSGMETPSERGGGCPPGVDVLVKRMMAPPDRRFSSAKEVRERIAELVRLEEGRGQKKSLFGQSILVGGLSALLLVSVCWFILTAFSRSGSPPRKTDTVSDSTAHPVSRAVEAQRPSVTVSESVKREQYATLVSEAKLAESNKKWQAAISAYEAALVLYDESETRKALARVASTRDLELVVNHKRVEFNRLVAEAEQAVKLQDFGSARQIYERAVTVAPTDNECARVQDLVRQTSDALERVQKRAELKDLLRQAEAAEGKKDLQAALDLYTQALATCKPDESAAGEVRQNINEITALLRYQTTRTVGNMSRVLFKDDFDSYPRGSFPAGWTLQYDGAGAGKQYVDNTHCVSPSQSLHLVGAGSWSANANHPVNFQAKPSQVLTITAKVYIDQIVSGGCSPNVALVGLCNPSLGSWGMKYCVVQFNSDGYLYALQNNWGEDGSCVKLMNYEARTWYTIRTDVDLSAKVFDVYINGICKAEGLKVLSEGLPTNVQLLAGHGDSPTAWFDDVVVSISAQGAAGERQK